MQRILGKTFGIVLASLCLVSTVAMAQPRSMVCTKMNEMGRCIEAKAPGQKVIVTKKERLGNTVKKTKCITTEDGTRTCTKVIRETRAQ